MSSSPVPSARPALEPIAARTSLRHDAIQTLQAAIVAGALRPGEVYSAPALAAQLGMSATPVREAMLDLSKDGLVETVRNKGFRVVELAESELDELTELRSLIEVPSVGQVADRGLSPAERARLLALTGQIEQAAHDQDMIAMNKADLAFHTELLALLGNATLVRTVRSLRTRSRLYGMARLAAAGTLHPTSAEHRELVELVDSGNRAGAEDLMRRHIGHVRRSWATGSQE